MDSSLPTLPAYLDSLYSWNTWALSLLQAVPRSSLPPHKQAEYDLLMIECLYSPRPPLCELDRQEAAVYRKQLSRNWLHLLSICPICLHLVWPWSFYRCYHCRLHLCSSCAAEHFGQQPVVSILEDES